uniref:Tudor domain-containing protein 1 n=1 Tax=Cuerna arida TaxID=1464854 RepID=A0A1B6GHY4_9HEMI
MSTSSSLRGVGRGRGLGLPFNSHRSLEMWESRPGHPAGGIPYITKPDPKSGYYKLHVKSIPLSWNENSLRNAFQKVGSPVSIFMSQPIPGVPFKWGFVEYETLNEALSAIHHLNDNIILENIEVAFARDKSSVDDIMEDPLYDYHSTYAPTYKQPLGQLDGLASFKRTVKNEAAVSHSWKTEGYEVVLGSNEKSNEEVLLQKVLEVYRNPKITPKDKCVVCGAGTFMGCVVCSTLYCSVNCQTRDWPSHSRTCKPSTRIDNGNRTDLRGAGDNRQMRQDMTNGFRSAANRFDERPQQNRLQNRFDDRPQSNDKLQNRFGDRSIDQITEANQDERSYNNNQSNSDPPRNLFEERRSRYNANKTNSSDSGRDGGQNPRGGAQRNQYERRNTSDRKNTNFNAKLDANDEKWDTTVKEIQMKAVSEKAVTPSVSSKTKATNVVTGPLTVGKKEAVIVLYKEPTMKYIFYVQLTTSMSQFKLLISKLDSIPNSLPVRSPALGDLCVAEFEHAWNRAQVTCLSPLTVKYIDFGNSETTTEDKLFTISTELKDIPPIAIKIKLADETPNKFLEMEAGEQLTIEPIEQVEDYWVVKVDGAHYPTNGARPDPVTPTHAAAQVTSPSAQNAKPSFPKLLPGDTFTEVYIVHRDPDYVSVTTLSRMAELKQLTKTLQEAAATAVPLITPQLQSKCLAKWSKTNSWFRGRVVGLEPLKVNFVDNGNTEICTLENLRQLPAHVIGGTPLAVRIDSKNEVHKNIMQKDIFSVKPLYKDSERNVWVVDVTPIKEETLPEEISAVNELSQIPVSVETPRPTVPSQSAAECHPPTLAQPSTENRQTVSTMVNQNCTENQQNIDIFPSFLPRNQFSTVQITYQNPEEKTGNVYFVGATTLIDALVDMNTHFRQSTAKDLQISTPQLGDIGLCQFEELWYRVRVTSVTPTLTVYFMDYGNTDPITAEGLRMCPESHKDIPELVKKIQLVTGTSEKYFNLPLESYLSIKPVSALADGTILVQVEGESYDVSIPVVSEPPVVPRVLTSPPPQPAPVPDTPSAQLQPQYTAQLLKQGWTAVFVPDRLDYITNVLLGSLVTEHLPETVSLMGAYHLETVMDVEPFDSSYKPKLGDVVGCQDRQEWVRGRLQEGEKVELVDQARVANLSNYKRLPAQFITIPYLAATFSLLNMDMDVLNSLIEKTEIKMIVSAVTQTEEGLSAIVTLQGEYPVEGVIRSWQYKPLACPDPLALGDLVTICNVISSNTIMVVPADNAVSHHTIQLECRKTGGLEKPPKVGDYVACEFSNEKMYCRTLVVEVDVNKDQYEVYKIDYGTTNIVNLNSLRPLTNIIRNLPCRARRVQLIGVNKINKMEMTAESQAYLNLLAEKTLKVAKIEFSSKGDGVALIVADSDESVNEKLAELIKPKILPDLNGKLTLGSIPVGKVLMHQEQTVIITQTEPLYVQLLDQAQRYYNESHKDIQIHCGDDQSLYNPCQSELCFAKFGDDWYRSLCVQESVSGVSTQMLVDFGNIFSAPTTDLRQMLPEFLNFPALGLACKIKGLPSELSPEQKEKLKSLLAVDTTVKVTFESEEADYYNVNIPAVITSLLS